MLRRTKTLPQKRSHWNSWLFYCCCSSLTFLSMQRLGLHANALRDKLTTPRSGLELCQSTQQAHNTLSSHPSTRISSNSRIRASVFVHEYFWQNLFNVVYPLNFNFSMFTCDFLATVSCFLCGTNQHTTQPT